MLVNVRFAVPLVTGSRRAARLDAAGQAFTGWTPHAEVGGGADGEHGAGGEH